MGKALENEFELAPSPEGIFIEKDGCGFDSLVDGKFKRIYIAYQPLWVEKLVFNADTGSGFSFELRYEGVGGVLRTFTIPASFNYDNGKATAKRLADEGVDLDRRNASLLPEYIEKFRDVVSTIAAVQKPGWVLNSHFATSGKNFSFAGSAKAPQLELQTRTFPGMSQQGTLDDWKTMVASNALEPHQLFSILVPLAAMLLEPIAKGAGGFHFHGSSGSGKTTTLMLAASVQGNPTPDSPDSFMASWDSTVNGLESNAETHSDLGLPVDELSRFREQRNFPQAIHMLTDGQGSAVMTSTRDRAPVKHWRIMILSTGELSVAEFLPRDNGHYEGAKMRLWDVPFDEMVLTYPDALRSTAAERANRINRNAGKYFGTAGPAFIEAVMNSHDSKQELDQALTNEFDAARPNIAALFPPKASMNRVIDRLTLVAIAGHRAVKYGILPHNDDDVVAAIETVTIAALEGSKLNDPIEFALQALRDFISLNAHQAQRVDEKGCFGPTVVASPKYYRSPTELVFLARQLEQALPKATYNVTQLLKRLRSESLLITNEAGRLKTKRFIEGFSGQRCHVFSTKMIDNGEHSEN